MADLRVHGNKRVAHPISIVVTASTPTCATRLVSAAWSFVVEGWIMPPIMVIAFGAGPPSTERRRPQHANTPRRTTGSAPAAGRYCDLFWGPVRDVWPLRDRPGALRVGG